MLFGEGLLFKLNLLQFPLVLLVSLFGEGKQVLVELGEGHGAFGLVDAVVVASRAHYHAWLAVGEDDGLGDQDGTALVSRLIRSSKFLKEPTVVFFFILEMISLVKLQRILVLDPLDFLHDTFLKHKMGVFCLLADDFRVLFHLMVQFFHFLVANHLFRQKLVLFSLVLDQIQDPRVHTILLDLIEMHSAYVTLTADFLTLLQKIGDIRIGFFSQSIFIQSHRFIVIELGSAGSSRV